MSNNVEQPQQHTMETIPLADGTALAHTLVQRVAQDSGIDAVFIKGPSAVTLGLRPARTSSDVDVWVRRADLARLISRLEDLGWIERPLDRIDDIFPVHSLTFYHPHWGCDIDVHFRFPGCDGDPDDVFDLLLDHAVTTEIAHREIVTVDKPAHAVILALHCLRTPWEYRNQRELDYLVDVIEPDEIDEIFACARGMKCLPALAPFLVALDPARFGRMSFGRASADWLIRTTARRSGSIRMINVIEAPWRQKPRLIKLGLFPSVEALRSVDLFLNTSEEDVRRARRRRLVAGLRALPSMLHDLIDHYRKVHDKRQR